MRSTFDKKPVIDIKTYWRNIKLSFLNFSYFMRIKYHNFQGVSISYLLHNEKLYLCWLFLNQSLLLLSQKGFENPTFNEIVIPEVLFHIMYFHGFVKE